MDIKHRVKDGPLNRRKFKFNLKLKHHRAHLHQLHHQSEQIEPGATQDETMQDQVKDEERKDEVPPAVSSRHVPAPSEEALSPSEPLTSVDEEETEAERQEEGRSSEEAPAALSPARVRSRTHAKCL